MTSERREWLVVRAAGRGEVRVGVGRALVRIGRAADCEVVLPDTFVSGQHAELVELRGERCVRDLGSTNGSRLNGEALEAGRLYALRDGDVLQLGTSEVVYHLGTRSNGLPGAPGPVPAPGPAAKGSRSEVRRAGVTVAESAAAASVVSAPAVRRRPRVPRLALRIGGGLLLVVLAVAVLTWLLAPPRVVLLVLGSDARPDELRRGEVGRTDTLLAVVVDRSPPGIALISIPRDLWVQIPGFGEERVNTAYALGGAATAERTVGEVLGVTVENHLLIGLQGVRDVVDAAGGIDVDVPRPIHDDAYPTDDYGTVTVTIPAGRQHMDGETALRYARTRHQDSDFGRMARQQQVMLALRDALLQPRNWWRLPAVLGAVRQTTQSDLGLRELATLALVAGPGAAEVDRLAIDLELVEEMRGANGAFLLRSRPSLRRRVAALLDPTTAGVAVLNGSQVTGRAQQAADRLRARSMHVVQVGDAPRPIAETVVEARPGLRRTGARVAAILDISDRAVREVTTLPETVDVRVTLGANGAGG